MANNKIELGDEVLIDLTQDTVTEDTLLEGETAHDSSGSFIVGKASRGGSSEWSAIQNKPFETINDDNFYVSNGEINVSAKVMDKYTQKETENLLDEKANSADVYTKTELNGMLNAKANATDVYTQTAVDGLLDAKANSSDVYTQTEVNELLDLKANASSVYTQGEVNNLLNGKANTADVYTKTQADDLLNNKLDTNAEILKGIPSGDYYDSTHTYVKGEIFIYNNKVYKAIVDTVPLGTLPTNTIYFEETTLGNEILTLGEEQDAVGVTDENVVWLNNSSGNSTKPTVSKRGKVCVLSLTGQLKSGTYNAYSSSGTGTTLGRLPFKPSSSISFVTQAGTSTATEGGAMRCASDGYLYFNNNKTFSANTWLTGQCVYFTNE